MIIAFWLFRPLYLQTSLSNLFLLFSFPIADLSTGDRRARTHEAKLHEGRTESFSQRNASSELAKILIDFLPCLSTVHKPCHRWPSRTVQSAAVPRILLPTGRWSNPQESTGRTAHRLTRLHLEPVQGAHFVLDQHLKREASPSAVFRSAFDRLGFQLLPADHDWIRNFVEFCCIFDR